MLERDAASETWLLFGLGNPGGRYERTRHNLGWLLVDRLAARHSVRSTAGRGDYFFGRYELEGRPVHLIKPTTYMNLSGRAVRQYLAIERPDSPKVVVATDDANIVLGRLRFRPSGSAGGHNGLSSIIESLRSDDFARLRMGVGPGPEGADLADFVLEDFEQDEFETVEAMIGKAADAFESWVLNGPQYTMGKFNG